jgi:hypothetical protein
MAGRVKTVRHVCQMAVGPSVHARQSGGGNTAAKAKAAMASLARTQASVS